MSSSPARATASRTDVRSMQMRASMNSRTLSGSSRNWPLSALRYPAGWGDSTTVPMPWWEESNPMADSLLMASRRVLRLTPNCLARSSWEGSFWPRWYCPVAIIS